MKCMLRSSILAVFAFVAIQAAHHNHDALQKAEKAWAQAVAKQDLKSVGGMLSDKLIYAHSTGIVESKDEYLGKMKSGSQKYTAITHEGMKIVEHGDTAVVHSTVRMQGSTKGEPFDNKLMMIHVWVKEGGNWKLAAHQTTRLNP